MDQFNDDDDIFLRRANQNNGLSLDEQNEVNNLISNFKPTQEPAPTPASEKKSILILKKFTELLELIDS